jgi:hypothetical protein
MKGEVKEVAAAVAQWAWVYAQAVDPVYLVVDPQWLTPLALARG